MRSVTLAVYTKKLAAVADLKAEELASEGGRERRILAVEPDKRRLEVAIVIDSTAGVASSYRSDLVPGMSGNAVHSFDVQGYLGGDSSPHRTDDRLRGWRGSSRPSLNLLARRRQGEPDVVSVGP